MDAHIGLGNAVVITHSVTRTGLGTHLSTNRRVPRCFGGRPVLCTNPTGAPRNCPYNSVKPAATGHVSPCMSRFRSRNTDLMVVTGNGHNSIIARTYGGRNNFCLNAVNNMTTILSRDSVGDVRYMRCPRLNVRTV